MDIEIKLDQELDTEEQTLKAALRVGDGLKNHPIFQEFSTLVKKVNADAQVQELARQIHEHQAALQNGSGEAISHSREMDRLEQQMNTLPMVQEYYRIEKETHELFLAVDEVISQAAGVAFAANAKRSGCCG